MNCTLNVMRRPDGTIHSAVVSFTTGGDGDGNNGRMVSLAFDAERADCAVMQEKWTRTVYPTYTPAIGINRPGSDSTEYVDLDVLPVALAIVAEQPAASTLQSEQPS